MLFKAITTLLVLLITHIHTWALEVINPDLFLTKTPKCQYDTSGYYDHFDKYRLKESKILLPMNKPHCLVSVYLSDEVTSYLEEIISSLKENSINRDKIDWEDFRFKFYTKMNGCAFTWQTYSKMNEIIDLLRDNHSWFLTPSELTEAHSENNFFLDQIKGEILSKNIAYLKIPRTSCISEEYAQKLRAIIEELDQAKPKKWIIDLRGNLGGNMWEMLAGLSPLLDQGIIGYFGHKGDDLCAWVHEPGKLKLRRWDEFVEENFSDFFTVKSKSSYTAVLIDSDTASAAEAVTIAFKGSRNTKLFGSKTHGLSTGNGACFLSDGSFIALTTCYYFDRNKQKYTDGIEPDVCVSSENPEDCLEEAIRWLNRQKSLVLFKS